VVGSTFVSRYGRRNRNFKSKAIRENCRNFDRSVAFRTVDCDGLRTSVKRKLQGARPLELFTNQIVAGIATGAIYALHGARHRHDLPGH